MGRDYIIIQDHQRGPDVFNFPPPPSGIPQHVVRDFVDALREEYVGGRRGRLGDFLNSQEAQATGGMHIFDNVENQIRNAEPDNRMDALNQLQRIWQDQATQAPAFVAPQRQHAPDVFSFPPPPPGIPQRVVRDFVDALREEYVGGRSGPVGDFMDSPEAQATGGMETFDNVESQIRDANPDNRMDALNQLQRIWQDQALEVVQGVPVAPGVGFAPSAHQALHRPEGGFAPSAPPPTEAPSRFPQRPAIDEGALRGFVQSLREEYQRRRQNAVGDWLNQNARACEPHFELLDRVENMMRSNPTDIDELERAWRL